MAVCRYSCAQLEILHGFSYFGGAICFSFIEERYKEIKKQQNKRKEMLLRHMVIAVIAVIRMYSWSF